MFCINNSQELRRRRQATALFLSGIFHVFALLALLNIEPYRLAESKAPSHEILYLACPMDLYGAPPVGVVERDNSAAGPNSLSKDKIASKMGRAQPPAPASAPVPLASGDAQAPPAPEEMPLPPGPGSLPVPDWGESALNKDAIASLLVSQISGSVHGLGSYGNASGIGFSNGGAERTGMGIGDGFSRSLNKTREDEREIGADGGPFLVKMSQPVYPKFARRIGKEGKVLLSMLIDEAGRLQEVRVVEKAGYGFDEAAMEAVKLSLFKPAVEKGTPVSCRARMLIRFQLKDVT